MFANNIIHIPYIPFILTSLFNSTAINDYVFVIDNIWVLKGKIWSHVSSTEMQVAILSI